MCALDQRRELNDDGKQRTRMTLTIFRVFGEFKRFKNGI